jgi:hypothetical protein
MTVQFIHVSAAQTITNTITPLTEKLLFVIKLAKAALVKCSQVSSPLFVPTNAHKLF